jgi:HK97 family phage prohead protease
MTLKSNPDCERLVFPVEFKLLTDPTDDSGGTVEGYASVFGLPHESGDIVEPGAFKKTIRERVKKGMVPYLDSHQWDVAHTIGSITDASEDSHGLHYTAKLSKSPNAQDARLKMAEGHIKRNSIGFYALRESWKPDDQPAEGDRADRKEMRRHIHEVKLMEISAVPLADDPGAVITSVKSAVPFGDLPLAPRDRAWDAGAARKRVAVWAGGGDDESKMNWARYRRAFLWFDRAKPEDAGSYKLPIADVEGGELTAIPRGIFAAAGVLQGARGGAELGGDEDAVRAVLERYYAKMAHQFKDDTIVVPWKKKSIDSILLEASAIGVYDLSDIRDAARELMAVLTPSDRAALAAELSAGPGSPPTENSDSDSLAMLRHRGTLLNAEIIRRRIS